MPAAPLLSSTASIAARAVAGGVRLDVEVATDDVRSSLEARASGLYSREVFAGRFVVERKQELPKPAASGDSQVVVVPWTVAPEDRDECWAGERPTRVRVARTGWYMLHSSAVGGFQTVGNAFDDFKLRIEVHVITARGSRRVVAAGTGAYVHHYPGVACAGFARLEAGDELEVHVTNLRAGISRAVLDAFGVAPA